MASGVVWEGKSLGDLSALLMERRATLPARVAAALNSLAPEIRDYMRTSHPWQNQTGDAERGLDAYVEEALSGLIALVLAHGVSYGVYLETKFGGRDAIIIPTLEAFRGQIVQVLTGVLW